VRRLHGLLGAALLLAVAFAACGPDETPTENPDRHDENEHTEEARLVRLTAAELDEFEIILATAAPGTISVAVAFPGEVKVNQDRFAHIVPRIPGFVHSANKSVGDAVRAGEVLAVLDSRDLADLKSGYLAGRERLELAEATFRREENLYGKKISSEQEFLQARQGLAEARIALRSARQKLLALGLSASYIEARSSYRCSLDGSPRPCRRRPSAAPASNAPSPYGNGRRFRSARRTRPGRLPCR
jgi:cobalt-zinc-cadmium efflux system membrane fusion protein